ncbi:MAG: amidohydrolase family protein [Pseudomonadota bacterium]
MNLNISDLAPLPDDVFVIDPVIHAFNLSRENIASRFGEQLYGMSYGLHANFSPPHATIEKEIYLTDMPIDVLIDTIFLETQTDLAATHTLTLHSWFKDGFCSRAKTERALEIAPQRVLAYLGVDPTEELEAVIADLESQHAAAPSAVGLKLYPHQVDPYRRWRADDEKVLRLIEHALSLGIKTTGIHKALPNGSVPLESYRIEDMEIAADAFPQMNFEIIHSGMAFVEETAFAISRFPNVYANLETTTALLYAAPGRFADILAQFLFWGGPEKIIYSSGCTVVHPQHLLSLFWDMTFDDAVMKRSGVGQLTPEIKRAILGQNYARMLGLNLEELRGGFAGDVYERRRGDEGLAAPWSSWRASGNGQPAS